jgi:hypothetical protein
MKKFTIVVLKTIALLIGLAIGIVIACIPTVAILAVHGLIVWGTWNLVIPTLFALPKITFIKATALFLLVRILQRKQFAVEKGNIREKWQKFKDAWVKFYA